MTTYTAWDGNEYPLPTPDGWYLASDDRWWPEGHGPGPAQPAAPPPPASAAPPPPSAPPPAGMPSAAPPAGGAETIYSSPPPGSGAVAPDALLTTGTSDDSAGNGKPIILLAVVLVGLLAVGAGAWFALSSGDDDEAAPATTVAPTELDDTDTTAAGADTTVAGDQGETEPETSETTATSDTGAGSPDNPYAIGDTIELRYEDFESGEERVWNIQVLEPLRNITDAVAAENQFNDPPPPDAQFMGVPVRVTYVSGPEPATLFDLSFKAVGPSGVVVATFDPSCGVIPDALDTFAELFQGGTIEGNLCWTVGTQDQEDLTMIVEVFFEDETLYADLTG